MGQVNLGTAEGRIVVDGSPAREGFAVAQSAAQAFFDVIADRVNELDRIGTQLTKIGAVAAGGFGLAINAAAGFEQRLSAIEAVSGATEQQMEAVSKKALQLGADTKFSAAEAAQAIEELVKAGISVEDALNGAADATVNLAAAGEIDLPRAAEIAANAMSVFNLSAAEMPKVADLIAGAANASAIDVEQFAQSLQQSGAAANLAGLSFDDLSTAIAIMGNAGIKGSDAGTSLKTMLLNLNPVTDKQKGLMEELGIITKDGANAFFDAEGKAKSFGEIAGVLQGALKGMTKQQQLATLETLFGSDAIRAAAVVADAGSKGFEDMATAMGKVTAASVAATRMDNLRGSLEQLKGSLETAAIIVGQFFLPALQKIVDVITKVVNVFNNAPEGLQKFLTVVVALGGGLSLLTGILIKLAFVLVPLLAKFLGLLALRQVFSIFTVGFKALRGGAGVLASLAAVGGRAMTVFGRFGKIAKFLFTTIRSLFGAVGALRVLVGFAFGPWGALIAGVVTAVILLYKKFVPFRELVDKIATSLKGSLFKALETGREALRAFFEVLKGEGTTGSGGVIGFFEKLGLVAYYLWGALKQLGQAFMQNLVPALKAAGTQIWTALKDAWAQMSAVITGQLWPALKQLWAALAPVRGLLAKFGGILLKVIGALILAGVALAGGLIFGLIKIATVIATYVLPALIKFVAFLITGVIGILGKIGSFLAPVISFFARVAQAIAAFVTGVVAFFTGAETAAGSGASKIKAALTGIAAFFVGIWNAIKTAVVTALTAVWTFITTAFTTIKTIFVAGLNFIKSLWTAFWTSQFGQVLLNAFGLIGDILKLAWAVIRFVFLAGIAFIKFLWNSFWLGLTTIITVAWGLIKAAVSAGIAFVKAVFVSSWNAIKAFFSAVWAGIVAVVAPRLARIKAIILAAWNAVKAFTRAAWNAIKTAILTPIANAASAVYARTAGIRARISAAWNAIKSATKTAWNAVVTAIKSAVDRAIAIAQGIKGRVLSAVSGAASWLYNAGRDIIQGLLDGINSMISSVRSKLQELTSLIPKSKGPPKRDKKLLYDNGALIMEGLIRGLTDQFRPFQQTLQGLTTSIPVTAMSNVTTSAVPKITLPAQKAPRFPQTVLLDVDGRTMRAYVRETTDGVLKETASKVGRGRK